MAAVLLAVVAGTAALAPGAPARVDFRVQCAGVTAIDVYFWPQGHAAVPELGFPSFLTPHVELYRVGNATGTGFLVFAGLGPRDFTPSRTCNVAGDRAMAWGGGPSATLTTQQKLRCTFTGEIDMQVASLNKITFVKKLVRKKGSKKKVPKRIRQVRRIGTLATVAPVASGAAVRIEIKSAGSTMRYDTGLCQPIPLTA